MKPYLIVCVFLRKRISVVATYENYPLPRRDVLIEKMSTQVQYLEKREKNGMGINAAARFVDKKHEAKVRS